jgi:hypothetical protein
VLDDFLVLKEFVVVIGRDTVVLGPLQELLLLRNDNGDEVVLKAISIDEVLMDDVALLESVFKLVRNDVLTLRKLENVLLSIDDLDGSIRENGTDITGVNPTF